MSDTPRTDAYLIESDNKAIVGAAFARDLERALTAAIARAEAAEATVERCKQVCAATAEGWRETQAELDRLTTLRLASEHDGNALVHWYELDEDEALTPCWGSRVAPNRATHWTPLPTLKEAT